MYLVEVVWGDMDWIGLAQDRGRWRALVNSVSNLWIVGVKARGKGREKPRPRWVDNIKMDLLEIGWGDVDWVGLAQDMGRWRALVNSVSNLWIVGGKARGKEATRKTKT
jgi:hypothetical protein